MKFCTQPKKGVVPVTPRTDEYVNAGLFTFSLPYVSVSSTDALPKTVFVEDGVCIILLLVVLDSKLLVNAKLAKLTGGPTGPVGPVGPNGPVGPVSDAGILLVFLDIL
jgi:hypothetical protein